MEVLGNDGNNVNELSQVIKKGETDCEGLFYDGTSNFDETFYQEICSMKAMQENEMAAEFYVCSEGLNMELTIEEVHLAIKKAKTGKATGIENLPNEVLKPQYFHTFFMVWFKNV